MVLLCNIIITIVSQSTRSRLRELVDASQRKGLNLPAEGLKKEKAYTYTHTPTRTCTSDTLISF